MVTRQQQQQAAVAALYVAAGLSLRSIDLQPMAESGPPDEGLEVETNWDEATPSFDLMDLKEELLRVH